MAESMRSDKTTAPSRPIKMQPSALRDKRDSSRVSHRSVVIQLPPKRRKVSSALSPREAIDLINRSVGFDERQEALATAIKTFEHNAQAIHDEEIAAGADSALTKHLALLLSQRGFSKSNEDDISLEIYNTCEALELIFRGTTERVSISFQRLGNELLRLLILVIDFQVSLLVESGLSDEPIDVSESEIPSLDPPAARKCGSEQQSSQSTTNRQQQRSRGSLYGDNTLRKATKVLGHFARVVDATETMCFFPGLLPNLIRLVCLQPYILVPAEARMNSLWIIANLACNAENMVMMACHPGIIDALVSMTFRTLSQDDTSATTMEVLRSQSIAVRALLNLSWASENRIRLSENASLVQVLTSLAALRKNPYGSTRSNTVQDLLVQTRRHAIGTLRNLAAAPRHTKICLCDFGQGMLLHVMTDAVLNDPDRGVQERAFATIHNLAVHDTAPRMVQHPALVLALKNALLEEETKDDEFFKKRKASAAGTLLVLERSITEDMDCYQNLRELLDAVNPSNEQDEGDSGVDEGSSPP